MTRIVHVDRYGVPLAVGMRVKVQHCVGRYGQTQTVVGTLRRLGECGSVDVTPEEVMPARGTGLPAGCCMYPGFQLDRQLSSADVYRGCQVLRGYTEWDDVEHAHVKFIEVLRSTGEEAEGMPPRGKLMLTIGSSRWVEPQMPQQATSRSAESNGDLPI